MTPYALLVYRSLHHFWWDVVLRDDHRWMDAHNGYMFLCVYAAAVACAAAALRRGE